VKIRKRFETFEILFWRRSGLEGEKDHPRLLTVKRIKEELNEEDEKRLNEEELKPREKSPK